MPYSIEISCRMVELRHLSERHRQVETWVGDMAEQADIDERAFNEAVRNLGKIADIAMGGVEGLDCASCSPRVKYLAEVGIGAAARGCSPDGWRTEVAKTLDPEEAGPRLEEAEECMRHSGLWPWN